MKKRFLLFFITSFLQAAHWGYGIDDGAEKWASLSPDYALCKTGKRQSPINITRSHLKPTENQLRFLYKHQEKVKNIINNGHSVQINFQNGSAVRLKNTYYSLVQLHFHSPSETQIEGKNFPMEMHIVHQDKQGNTLVIAALFEEGKENLNINNILPKQNGYYAFDGSLTTPPCNENVQWVVFVNPIQISKKQIETFQAVLHHNARNVQPLGDRVIEVAPPLPITY